MSENRIQHTIAGQPAPPSPEQIAAEAEMKRKVAEAKSFLSSGKPLSVEGVHRFLTQALGDAEAQRTMLAEQLKLAEAMGNPNGQNAILSQALAVKHLLDHCTRELSKLGVNGKA